MINYCWKFMLYPPPSPWFTLKLSVDNPNNPKNLFPTSFSCPSLIYYVPTISFCISCFLFSAKFLNSYSKLYVIPGNLLFNNFNFSKSKFNKKFYQLKPQYTPFLFCKPSFDCIKLFHNLLYSLNFLKNFLLLFLNRS